MTTIKASTAGALIKMRDCLAFYLGSGVGLLVAQVQLSARGRDRNERGEVSSKTVRNVIVVLGITSCVALLFSTFFTGKANSQLDDAVALSESNKKQLAELEAITESQKILQQRLSRQSKCQQRVFEKQSDALISRSSFSEQQALAQKKFVKDWRDGIGVLLQPNVPVDQVNAALMAMYDAANVDLRAINESLAVREVNPYPTQEEVQACRTLD